jgi:hypothetical protein
MLNANVIRTHNCIAKQAGFMPSGWNTIESLSYDRLPEICPGSGEGAGYA